MNEKLKKFLTNIFSLSDDEFCMSLSKENITRWDSLKHMELISGIEREFNLELTMTEIVEMTTFESIERIVAQKLNC